MKNIVITKYFLKGAGTVVQQPNPPPSNTYILAALLPNPIPHLQFEESMENGPSAWNFAPA